MKFKIFTFVLKFQSLSDLGEAILADRMTEAVRSGFQISQISRRRISGRYLEEGEKRFRFYNNEGEMETLDVKTFNHVRFVVDDKLKALIVYEPQGKVEGFLTRLSKASKFKLRLSPREVSLSSIIDCLKQLGGSSKVEELTAGNIKVGSSVIAAVKLKGDVNAEHLVSKKVLGYDADLNSARLACSLDALDFSLMWKPALLDVRPTPEDREEWLLRFAEKLLQGA